MSATPPAVNRQDKALDPVKGAPLRVLIVEDTESDARLVLRALQRSGYAPAFERVESADAMRAALARQDWDLILSDYVMPGFGGIEALHIAKQHGLDLPFVLVSNKVSEEVLVEAMRAGAMDFVMKDHLERLGPVVKRELADAAARASAKRARLEWRTVLDSVQDAIFVHDAECRIVRANLKYAALAQMPVQDLIGKPYWEVFPRAAGPLPGCMDVCTGKVGLIEEEVRLPTGQVFSSRAFPIASARGDDRHYLHVLQDTTERNRVREAIEQSEQRHRGLMKHASDLVIVMDAHGVITYSSPSLKEIGGYEPDEVLGRNFLEYVHPANQSEAMARVAAIVAEPDAEHRSEFRYRRKDGTWYVLETVSRNALADPLINGIVVNARNVTERNRAAKALRVSRDLLGLVVENAPVRVFWKDLDLRFLGCNSSFARDAGMTRPEELLGKDDFQMPWREHAEKYRADDRSVIESNMPRVDIVEEQAGPDGRRIWVRTSKAPLRAADGRPFGVLGIYEDITERRLADLNLKKVNRALRVLSTGNTELVRATNEAELLEAVCRAAVEVGGYRIAWVGYAIRDDACTVEVQAAAGVSLAELRAQPLTWEDREGGRGPFGRAIRSGHVQIAPDVYRDEGFAPWRELARAHGIASFMSLPLHIDGEILGALNIYGSEANAFDDEEMKLLTELAGDLAFGIRSLRVRRERDHALEANLRSMEQLGAALKGTVEAVALTVEKRDPYTAGHQRRVADLSAAIGQELGLPPERIEGLRLGATIHDIGKIYVPAEILSRPGRLTPAEMEIIKTHTSVGFEIIKGIDFPWPIGEMVLQHHERLDGSGYPQGLKGEQIILEARIIGVADVVEAMSSHRPYRPGLGIEAALAQVMKEAGPKLDADAVAACVRLFREKGFQLPA